MKLLLPIVLAGCAIALDAHGAPPAEARGPLLLRLAFEARAAGGIVRLADVAQPLADPERIWSEVEEMVVAGADARFVSRGKLERRLLDAGLPARAVRLTGPALCELGAHRAKGSEER